MMMGDPPSRSYGGQADFKTGWCAVGPRNEFGVKIRGQAQLRPLRGGESALSERGYSGNGESGEAFLPMTTASGALPYNTC